MRALEARLAAQEARIVELEQALATREEAKAVSTPLPVAAAATPPKADGASRLRVSGDLRLREEFNWSDQNAPDRTRTVLRARLRATYAVSSAILVGAQLATGDPNDPNTTDVTVGNFVDDLDVSLDQVYGRLSLGDFTAHAGKFPLPFRRTDLVWDGDVSPQGVGAIYAARLGNVTADARALYFVINESAAAKGSDMLGGQLTISAPFAGDWQADLAGGYYDYRLRSLTGADAGDFRSNLRTPTGDYLSDFNLADAIVALSYRGFGARWPLAVTAEYVRNLGSATDADSGFLVELSAGRAAEKGDVRIAYGYSLAETDAVFAAFSHDNLTLATNYRLHAWTADYVLRRNLMLNLTYYRYRPEEPADAGENLPHDWFSRARVNLLVGF